MCVNRVCLEGLDISVSSISSGSYTLSTSSSDWFFEPHRVGFDGDIPGKTLECSKVSTYYLSLGLCICYYLLQDKPSLDNSGVRH